MKRSTKAKEGNTKGNLAALRSTLNIYYSDNNGIYPQDDLSSLVPKYLKKIPEVEIPGGHAKSSKVYRSNGALQVMDPSDFGGWLYGSADTQPNIWGMVMINCTMHYDLNGVAWSSY